MPDRAAFEINRLAAKYLCGRIAAGNNLSCTVTHHHARTGGLPTRRDCFSGKIFISTHTA
ncbi:MAG: hypothetical protein IPJ50_18870 [Betaproteobacteria bacterium]|nr:hypothetical protein [Betaproteobacteria bacterium]